MLVRLTYPSPWVPGQVVQKSTGAVYAMKAPHASLPLDKSHFKGSALWSISLGSSFVVSVFAIHKFLLVHRPER